MAMTRAQDVLDYISAMHDLGERHSSLLAFQRYGMWGTGTLLIYDYDKSSRTHLRILGAQLL